MIFRRSPLGSGPIPPATAAVGWPQPAIPTGSFLALLLGAVAIGFAPIFVRLSEVGPVSTAFWRLVLALPVLWFLAGLERRALPAVVDPARETAEETGPGFWREPNTMSVLAGVLFAGDLAVWHWSIHFTSVANSTLLANFAPIFVVLFGWVAFRQRVTRRFVLAMGVALAGTILLVGSDFHLQPRALLGDALGLITAVFYAGYLLSVKSLRATCSTMTLMARTGTVTALALAPVALVSGERHMPGSARGWMVLAGLALVSHVAGQSLIAYALAKLPTALASLSLLVQPVTAAIAAGVLLGERIAPFQLFGVVLVLAGVFVARQEAR